MKPRPLLIHAAQIADGAGTNLMPGAMLIDRGTGRIVGIGRPEQIGRPPAAEVHDLSRSVVIPALVNAHAHLDLTHIGPLPWSPGKPGSGDFVSWVDAVRARRATHQRQVRESVLEGAAKSVAGGTGFIGDIAGVGSFAAAEALRDSELNGVSYLEIFGQGAKENAAIESLKSLPQDACQREGNGVRIGLQPHAPYSCSRRVYQQAAHCGLPLATHLAETIEELAFVREARGPLAGLLHQLGVWDDRIQPTGMHPIDYLADVLAQHSFLAAHLNYVDDHHLDRLADWSISVAYCPRASAYFGHGQTIDDHQPSAVNHRESSIRHESNTARHRYREMLDRGINVALGTDSILCLDTSDRISVLDEMRLLLRRDSVAAQTLLGMATVNGARALGIDRARVSFTVGATPGVLALPIDPDDPVEPLQQAITDPSRIEELSFIMMPAGAGAVSACW